MKVAVRKILRWTHLWLGLTLGLFVCLMGFSGGLVGLRPQIATWLSPAAATTGCVATDWDRAAGEITSFAHSEINRVYGPYGTDTRYHFRMATDNPIIFKHVIYDACGGRVLGFVNMGWMDWTVDLHHNLLNGRTGRRWTGAIGILMLISSLTGIVLWLLTSPNLRTAFQVRLSWSKRTPRELHRAMGLLTTVFLTLEAFTGLWLSFPQTMRGMLAPFAPPAADVRPARGKGKAKDSKASLGAIMAAAHAAMPDGFVREIRVSEGGAPVQVRMWRPGDFRSLGNNVVFLSASDAHVLAQDRYSERNTNSVVVQGIAALHYDEWGGAPFRFLSAFAGLVTPVLFVSGCFIWWYSRPKKKRAAVEKPAEQFATTR